MTLFFIFLLSEKKENVFLEESYPDFGAVNVEICKLNHNELITVFLDSVIDENVIEQLNVSSEMFFRFIDEITLDYDKCVYYYTKFTVELGDRDNESIEF